MTINGIDTEVKYSVREWNLEKSYASISNNSEMPDGWMTPVMLKSQVGLKTIKVDVMITGTRAEIWQKGGAFVGALLNPVEIQFRDFPDRYFYGVIRNAGHAETCLRRWHKASVELIGYEYGAERTVTATGTGFTIDNPGDIVSPCNVGVMSGSAVVQLKINGLVRDPFTGTGKAITFSNLYANVQRIIRSDKGTVLEGSTNKFDKTEFAEFPSLLPGENVITLNRSGITTTITYRPYYA